MLFGLWGLDTLLHMWNSIRQPLTESEHEPGSFPLRNRRVDFNCDVCILHTQHLVVLRDDTSNLGKTWARGAQSQAARATPAWGGKGGSPHHPIPGRPAAVRSVRLISLSPFTYANITTPPEG